MLHLQSGVHLEEGELVRPVVGDEELDRADAPVPHAPRDGAGGLTEPRPLIGVDEGRRGLLDDLLVSTLERALAFAEMEDGPVGVGEHLHLDVPGPRDEPFEEQRRVAEGRLCDPVGRGDRGGQLLGALHHLHALATAAARRFHDEREPDLDAGRGERVVIERGIGDALDDRHPSGGDVVLGPDLVPHELERSLVRADEDDPGCGERPREGRLLGQEAVAGVHRLRPGRQGGGDDGRDVEVALGGDRRSDPDRTVGEADVRGVAVCVAVDGDTLDAHGSETADDAAGDLAAVRDEDGPEGALQRGDRSVRGFGHGPVTS